MNAYEEIGGNVISFGKPNKEFFNTATELGREILMARENKSTTSAQVPRYRAIHLGDSLHHDIAGAHAGGIDSVLVTKWGVHAKQLNAISTEPSQMLNTHTVNSILNSEEQRGETGQRKGEIRDKSAYLRRVMNLCDSEAVKRPVYIIDELKWSS